MSDDAKLPWFKFFPYRWLSSEDVDGMTATERGIYITMICQQWILGSLPRDRNRLGELLHVDCRTVGNWMGKYKHLTTDFQQGSNRFLLPKVNELQGILRKSTPDHAGEEKRLDKKREKSRGDVPPSPPSPALKSRQGVSKQDSFEPEPADQDGTPAQASKEETPDANPVSRKFMDALFSLGRKEFKNGASRDACNAAFEGLLRMEPPAHVLNVIEYILQNEVYARGLRTIERMEPWDWFVEKFDGMVNQMNADEEFAAKRKKRLEKEAPKVPANAPEYRKNPTGREFLKPSDL